MGFVEIRPHDLFAWLGWLQTTILPISASWVARITGMIHQHLAFALFYPVRMKEALKGQRDGSNTSTEFIVQEGALPREISRQSQTWRRYRERSRWEIRLGGRYSQNVVKDC
jgi:hypothetical protein